MIVTFNEEYLRDLDTKGKTDDKKHRFQPQIIQKYARVINLMKHSKNVLALNAIGSLH